MAPQLRPRPGFNDGMLPLSFPFLVTLGLCAGGYLLSLVLGAK